MFIRRSHLLAIPCNWQPISLKWRLAKKASQNHMQSQFVKVSYYRKPAQRSDALRVSAIGHIEMPEHFTSLHELRKGTQADLYWDSETQAIAIVFAPKSAASAFPIFAIEFGSASIPARSFFRVNGLDPVHVAGEYRYKMKTAKEVGITDVAAEHEVYIITLDVEHRL